MMLINIGEKMRKQIEMGELLRELSVYNLNFVLNFKLLILN